jgi:hypothetical protein
VLAANGAPLVVFHLDGLEAAHLLVECVKELLACRRACESRSVKEGASEPAEVEQAFGRPVERDAHAVKHVDDARRSVGHTFDGRLVRQEVAAIHGLLQVNLGGIAFALGVHTGVDSALRADRVRALHRHEREQIDRDARLA